MYHMRKKTWRTVYYSANCWRYLKMLTTRNDAIATAPRDNIFGGFLNGLADSLRQLVARMQEISVPNVNPYHNGVSPYSSRLFTYLNIVLLYKTLRRRDRHGRSHIATFIWPIFSDLRDRELDFDESTSSQLLAPKHSYREKEEHWLLKRIYKPSARRTIGIISTLNLAIMVLNLAGIKVLVSIPVSANVGIFGLSALYIAPMLGYYYLEKHVREELEEHLAEAQARAEAGYHERAYQMICDLPLQYRILLHPYYPGNAGLRWSHLHLRIYLRHNIAAEYGDLYYEEACKEAVETAQNVDDKFKIIRLLLIRSDDLRKMYIKYIKENYAKHRDEDRLKKEIAVEEKEYAARIGPFLPMLPVHSKLHIKYAKDLNDQLDAVIELMRNKKEMEASEKFQQIEWNGYYKVAFPAAAARYYQTESLLVARLINKPPETRLHPELRAWNYMQFMRANCDKIQRYLDRFGSASHSRLNRKYTEYHDSSFRILWSHDEPPAGIPPNTPAWVMYKDKFISRTEDKQKNGELKRTSSLPDMLEHRRLPRRDTF